METIAPTWLTIEQAAAQLQVPKRVIRDAIESGALEHWVVGKLVRIHPRSLEKYCELFTVKSWSVET